MSDLTQLQMTVSRLESDVRSLDQIVRRLENRDLESRHLIKVLAASAIHHGHIKLPNVGELIARLGIEVS